MRFRFFLFGFYETVAVVNLAFVADFGLSEPEGQIAVKTHFTYMTQLTH